MPSGADRVAERTEVRSAAGEKTSGAASARQGFSSPPQAVDSAPPSVAAHLGCTRATAPPRATRCAQLRPGAGTVQEIALKIGVAREIKNNENRVALTP